MINRTIFAAAFALSTVVSGAAVAQTGATGAMPGATESNMNNPGSVKSNSEKMQEGQMPASTGSMRGEGTMAPSGAATAPNASGMSSPMPAEPAARR